VCTVRSALENKVELGKDSAEFIDKLAMLDSAPGWLTAARINKSGLTTTRFKELAADP
jgi:hypothetical protein